MSWIEAVLARSYHFKQQEEQELEPKEALSLLTSGEFWKFERAAHRSTHLPPRRDSQGHILEPAWALVFSFSLINDPALTEEGLNVLSEVVSSPEAARDPEMAVVANAFAAWGLSRLNLSERSIKVTEAALESVSGDNMARLFLQQQLTVHLTDANRYDEALHVARQARITLDSWKREHVRPYPPAQQEVLSGMAAAIESNIRMLQNVTSPKRGLSGMATIKPNKYWRDRNIVLEGGLSKNVRDSFNEKLMNDLGRSETRLAERESPRFSLATYLWESELAGHYRRMLAARSLLGKLDATGTNVADEIVVRGFTNLIRQSRDSKSYEGLLQVLIAGGPISALANEVQRAAEEISWPPRKEDFIALKVGGSLLPKASAKHSLRVLLDMPLGAHVRDLTSIYLADAQIWPAVRSLVKVADDHSAVSLRMRKAASHGSAHVFTELVATVRAVDWTRVSASELSAWQAWMDSPKDEEAVFLEQEVAQAFARLGNTGAIEKYFSRDSDLTIPAVATLIDFGSEDKEFRLPDAVAEGAARTLRSELDQLMLDATKGSYSFGVVDSILLAGIFSHQYPDHSLWQEISQAIAHPRVSISQKSGIFEWLGRHPENLPNDFVLEEEQKTHLLDWSEDWMDPGGRYSALRFLCARKLLPQEEILERLMNLATSDVARERAEAARTLPIAQDSAPGLWTITILDVLVRDPSPAVRSLAGAAIGAVITKTDPANREKIDKIVRRCLESDGVWVPLRTLRGLMNEIASGHPVDISGFRNAISTLANNHADHFVRAEARRVSESLTS